MDRVDPFLLLRRIEAHGLDEPGAADPFSARLARENRWSPDHPGAQPAEQRRQRRGWRLRRLWRLWRVIRSWVCG